MMKLQYKKMITVVLFILSIAFVAAQFFPTTLPRANPPVTGEPPWDTPATRETFYRVCADCHSNETMYPWYSSIAPASWIIDSDVSSGRRHFNVSEWDASSRGGGEAADQVRRGAMPVGLYLLMHPEANLNVAEKKQFVEGLIKTFGSDTVEVE